MFLVSALVSYFEEVKGVVMPPSQHWYCCLMVFFTFSSFLCSTYILIAVTFERFYSIIRPLNASSFNTVKRARILIICVFMFGFTYCIPYLFIAGNEGKFCVVNRFASGNVLGEMYHWLTEICIFIFPFLSLLIMNSVIIHTLRKRSKLIILETSGERQGEGQQIKHSEKQIFTMLLLITFVFLFLNIPTRALVFYLNFSKGDTRYYYAGLNLFFQIGDKSYVTNHAINFFLYVLSGQKFRTDLKNLFFPMKSNKNNRMVSNVHTISSSLSS